MIAFVNVSLTCGKKEILKSVSFHCEKGKITSIIGRNGAGKTSAIQCMLGERSYTGRIFLDGADVRSIPLKEKAKRISYLPQMLADVPFSVYELTCIGRRPYQSRIGKMSEADCEEVERALKLTDMVSFSERSISSLSGGEKQRAYLAMILAQNTDVIALDEPATYMDASVEKELFDLIRMLSGEMGKTIVQIMHNLNRAVTDSDSIVILDGGRVIKQLEKNHAVNDKIIEEIFSVKKGVFLSPDGEERTVYL